MLDLMTQISCAAYIFIRRRLGGNQTYFRLWQHFFVVPGEVTRSFIGDDLSDPEGPMIRASLPLVMEPVAEGPAMDEGPAAIAGPAADTGPAAVAGPAEDIAVVNPAAAAGPATDPVFAATAARGEAAASAAVRPTPSFSAAEKGKSKFILKARRPTATKGKEQHSTLYLQHDDSSDHVFAFVIW
jgi:hypothetical protein